MKKVIALFILFGFTQALGHPGPMNKEGCHINSDTGRKHCHKVQRDQSQVQRLKKKKKNKKRKNNRQEKLFSKI